MSSEPEQRLPFALRKHVEPLTDPVNAKRIADDRKDGGKLDTCK